MRSETRFRDARSSASGATRTRGRFGLSNESLRGARDRLRRYCAGTAVFAILLAGAWTLVGALSLERNPSVALFQGFGLSLALSSAGLFLLLRSPALSDFTAVIATLGWSALAAGALTYLHAGHETLTHGHFTAFGPHVLVVLMFPLVVPSTEWLTALTCGLAVLSAAAAMALAAHLGHIQWHGGQVSELIAVLSGASVLSVIQTRVLYRLRFEATRGRRLGSYELLEKLGEGGMGDVWRCRHQLLAREAAVKIIRTDHLPPGEPQRLALERFRREAQATAQLSSMHTVRLYDFGSAAGDQLYFAMELLDGVDLDALVRQEGPLPAGRVVRILEQICDSLAEAHAQGLVHRDIKPANVMLCQQGQVADVAKVLDFGLVALMEHNPMLDSDQDLTAQGMMMGTPAYMAPEAANPLAADERSDIYSLGCVALWLLTAQRVFELDDGPMAQVIAHARDTPEPPSARGIALPAALEALVMDCLAKEPDARPRSVVALQERLRALGPLESGPEVA